MAVISKYVDIGGRTLIKHESDLGKMIRQVETGREYASAVDVIPCRYTYEETEKDVLPRKGVTADEAGTA